MKTSETARKMKVGGYKYFSSRAPAVRLYHALRRVCGSRVTGTLKIVPSGFHVYKVKA